MQGKFGVLSFSYAQICVLCTLFFWYMGTNWWMNVDCGGLKFKLMLCLNKLHDIGICERVEVKLHKCLPSTSPLTSGILRVGGWAVARGGLDAVWREKSVSLLYWSPLNMHCESVTILKTLTGVLVLRLVGIYVRTDSSLLYTWKATLRCNSVLMLQLILALISLAMINYR